MTSEGDIVGIEFEDDKVIFTGEHERALKRSWLKLPVTDEQIEEWRSSLREREIEIQTRLQDDEQIEPVDRAMTLIDRQRLDTDRRLTDEAVDKLLQNRCGIDLSVVTSDVND